MVNKMISLRVEEELLQKFDEFCKMVGGDRTTMITMFMTNCVNTNSLPFKVTANHTYPTFDE